MGIEQPISCAGMGLKKKKDKVGPLNPNFPKKFTFIWKSFIMLDLTESEPTYYLNYTTSSVRQCNPLKLRQSPWMDYIARILCIKYLTYMGYRARRK